MPETEVPGASEGRGNSGRRWDGAGVDRLFAEALRADLERWRIEGRYDTVVAIGLLMFFPRERALALLRTIQEHVEPGGIAVVNVLVEGTTFLGMFEGSQYYLFGPGELEERFAGWRILSSRHDTFPAPGETRKEFSTVVAQKPGRTP